MEKTDILEMAKELGLAIENSKEFENLKNAETIQANDEKAQNLIGEYNLARMNIMQKAQGENLTQEDYDKIRTELADEFDKLMCYDVIKNFIDAKEAFDSMYEQVKNIVDFYANGEKQSSGCSGSCSSCGGCH